jgi:hypothetical protein
VPSDEEIRRVAEDLRALGRSLARDLRDAARSANGGTRSATRSATDNFKQGVLDVTREASTEIKKELRAEFGRRVSGVRRYGTARTPLDHWWSAPSAPGAAPRSGSTVDPTVTGVNPPHAGPSWAGASRGRHRSGPPQRRLRSTVPPVRRRWDGPVVAAIIAVTLGGTWLVSALGLVAVSAEAVMAGALMLLGAAIVVSARTDWSLSRHAWPVLVGLALIVGLFATSSAYGVGGAFAHLSLGNKTVAAYRTGTYYGGVGVTVIDATKAPPDSVIDVRGLVGEVIIEAPASFTVSGRVLVGSICAGSQMASGVGASLGPVFGSGAHPVIIDIHELVGHVELAGPSCAGDNS